MSKVQKKVMKKNEWIHTATLLLISFCAFFVFTFGNFLTDSQKKQVYNFFKNYITSDMVIQHNKNKSPASVIMPDFYLSKEELFSIHDYTKIEDYLKNNDDISSFTPYSFYPATILNTNKGIIPIFLKKIDSLSFSKEFPEIEFTGIDGSPRDITDIMNGIYLPPSLITQIEELYHTDITEGDFIFIADKDATIYSARETIFSGIVMYNRYTSLLPFTAYIDSDSFSLFTAKTQLAESSKNYSDLPFQDMDKFYRHFTMTEPPIKIKNLSDKYFFEFFTPENELTSGNNNITPDWQYIALSVKEKNNSIQIRNILKDYFYNEDIPVIVWTQKEIAQSILNTILLNRIFLYILTLIMLIILFILFTIKIRAYFISFKNNKTEPESSEIFHSLRKIIISLNIKTIISGVIGIWIGVLIIPVINNAQFPIGNDIMSTILAGGTKLYITLSIQIIFISILVAMLFTGLINIFPLSLLYRMRHQSKSL